jgi:hypothetical protein
MVDWYNADEKCCSDLPLMAIGTNYHDITFNGAFMKQLPENTHRFLIGCEDSNLILKPTDVGGRLLTKRSKSPKCHAGIMTVGITMKSWLAERTKAGQHFAAEWNEECGWYVLRPVEKGE